VRLVGSRTVVTSLVVPLAGLLLHRDVMCGSSVAGLNIHAQLVVKKGYLLVELASPLCEFVESRPPLGVGDAEPASVQSYSMRRPRRCCIPTWGLVVAWFVPSESL
jgi:hypothetical protein